MWLSLGCGTDGSVHAERDESINGAHCRGATATASGVFGGADSEGNLKTHEPKSRRILLSYHRILGHQEVATGLRLFRKPALRCKTEYAGL